MVERSKATTSALLAKKLIGISVIFAAGYLLGGTSLESREALRPITFEDPLDESLLPTKEDQREMSERLLVDDSDYDDDSSTLLIEEQDILDADLIISSLEAVENHSGDEEFFETEDILMDEEITVEPTEEELDEPEDFLDGESDYVGLLDYDRKLEQHDHSFHIPLPCNEKLEAQPCSSFRKFVVESSQDSMLVVPCGKCLKVDYHDGTEIELPNGLSINGKLYFDSKANVTLRTKFVWVVGLLKIDTPDADRQVKFSLYGEELQTYTSVNPNCTACSSDKGGCNMGSKVIAVVGGKLDIKGAEDNCPAWEKLTDIGVPTPRPFKDHLPCDKDDCWEDDIIELRGKCSESKGHTEHLKKYTVFCPIQPKTQIRFGSKLGIKLTSVEKPSPEFVYPKNNGEELSLTVSGKCTRHSHTNVYGKCVVGCPIKKTALIKSGSKMPLTFTSVKPDDDEFKMPSKGDETVSLRLNGQCFNSGGHTNSFKRCAVMCRLFPTLQNDGGERSGKLEFTSKFVDEPIPFPVPTSKKDAEVVEGKFILKDQCGYMSGHTNAWGGCVVRCPVEKTLSGFGSFHAAARLNNMKNNGYVNVKRILSYAHGGVHMYLLLQDVSKDRCSTEGASALNNVFEKGDEIVPSYQVETNPSADGNTFDVDQIVHYSWKKKTFLFLPSESDTQKCGETAREFSSKFPSGYEVKVDYKNKPPGGDTFNVNEVLSWAYNQNHVYFLPEKSEPEACGQTASDFSAKFPKNYRIKVSTRDVGQQLGETIEASKGVHHWSWGTNGLFFFPDEKDDKINEKFGVGFKIKVDYLTASDVYDIKVSPEAAKCWKPGTELLLTSHTRWSKDQQVRNIQKSNEETGILTLSDPIKETITMADHKDFAIEIASLNRRIVFEADSDADDSNIGGHLIVHHTESSQNIQGVEVRNFGQQGRLGRYPIHFHQCGDSPESLVRRNVVRNSNQRCYVVHLTNKVTLEENVAYDAFGHCYFIEDGHETGNIFRKNLGSGIKKMPSEAVKELEDKSKRSESDGTSSVFWISNPNNYFYDNVAAGGQGHGYWFETHGLLRSVPLGAFVNNEVHSAERFAFTTYPPGWRPSEVAIIDNLKSYRNPTWGAFLHVTQNLHFKGGLFADNRDKAVMISRGDDLVFDGTTFIGQTKFADNSCHNNVAIHLDPVRLQETVIWNFSGNKKGSTVKNVNFQNWAPVGNCPSRVPTPLKFFSHQTFIKSYSAPHVFEDLNFGSTYFVDAMMPDTGIDDVQIEITSDKHNALSTGGEKGFMISPKLETFVSTDCRDYNRGLKFCPNACIRTVSVLAGNSAFINDNIDMIVADQNGREMTVKKDVRGHPGPKPEGNRFFSAYTIALPKGAFTIRFVDMDGSPSWPRYAFVVPEAAPVSCDTFVDISDFTLVKPEASRPVCQDLIFNGKFESGVDGWYANHHSIELRKDGGINGSAAIANTKALNKGNTIAQSIDGSCLEAGNQYDISFTFKIIDYDGSTRNLPYVRLESQNYLTSDPTRRRFQTVSANVFSNPSINEGGWRTISGIWIINDKIANADKHKFHVGGGSYKVLIDNVSIQRRQTMSLRRRSNV